ncbi:hypothetical protein [Mucilaginibacter aquariorum]|uniref:EAL domain-containing protein n=1 Tax=Mucilaginibacter aquariorum TaxID=2967225 RepID=A0ABT1T0D5_9SPHI|nr:hypothetical protein [Mucilaginibacter aquariorum]MCQ6958049.1 hypothetical protein [Mucilaginibacter aquariorum]
MNFASSRTWAGIGFSLLFLINAGLVIAGLFFDYLWCTLSGIVLSLVQLWLYDRFSRNQKALAEHSFLSDFDLQLVISRSRPSVSSSGTNANGFAFDAGHKLVQCCDTTMLMAGNKLFTEVGTGNCRLPYRMNLLNIGSLNIAALDKGSLLALSRSAKMSDCAVNTGVLGIVPELLRGGSDLIWRMDRLDASYRNKDGSFNEAAFRRAANRPYIKMIEIKIKAVHFLPDVSEISLNRLIIFLERLKILSGGKPTGVCVAVTDHALVARLCRLMAANIIYLDFVTLESAQEKNAFTALFTAIDAVRLAIAEYRLPTKIIASGDLARERDILQAIGYGAHACYSVRPFQVALGAARGFIKSTTNSKVAAVTAFHQNTLAATIRLITACAAKQTTACDEAPINAVQLN